MEEGILDFSLEESWPGGHSGEEESTIVPEDLEAKILKSPEHNLQNIATRS